MVLVHESLEDTHPVMGGGGRQIARLLQPNGERLLTPEVFASGDHRHPGLVMECRGNRQVDRLRRPGEQVVWRGIGLTGQFARRPGSGTLVPGEDTHQLDPGRSAHRGNEVLPGMGADPPQSHLDEVRHRWAMMPRMCGLTHAFSRRACLIWNMLIQMKPSGTSVTVPSATSTSIPLLRFLWRRPPSSDNHWS